MIPKVIHYCWFGRNPLPGLANKCIESWKKYLPDYEIKEWNEDNFDVNMVAYTAEAYKNKKYAFVSDYARFWILYNYGGIYFDTDVEVIKPMNEIINKGSFMGCEQIFVNHKYIPYVNAGLGMGVIPKNSFFKEILDVYNNRYFISAKGGMTGTVVQIITALIKNHDEKIDLNKVVTFKDITLYPSEYFAPKNYNTGELTITEKTCTIHHYVASWSNKTDKLPYLVSRMNQIKTILRHFCFIITYKLFKR